MTDIQLKPILDALSDRNYRLEDILRSMARPGTTTPELDWDGERWFCYWIVDGDLCIGRSTDPRHAVRVAVAAAQVAQQGIDEQDAADAISALDKRQEAGRDD
jgi:hypothetical protein